MKKMQYVYTLEYYSTLKNGTPVIRKNMDETGVHYMEWKEAKKRDKYCMVSLICKIIITKTTYRNRRELNGGCQSPGVRNREILVKVYKLSLIRWIMFEDLVYHMVMTVDNIILYNWNFLGDYNLTFHKKF